MFIVKKNINGNDYYYLNKSVREGGKVISKTIAYLGKTKEEAEKKAEEIKRQMENKDNTEKIEEGIKEDVGGSAVEGKALTIEELANFCKEKGFVYRSSDIYGGFAGFWDFGPLGVELFNNIRQNWWNFFVRKRDDMVGMEASVISHPKTWEASGHIASFSDIAVICKNCKKATKLDKSELGKV